MLNSRRVRILAVDDEADTIDFYSEFFSSLDAARPDNPELRALESRLFGADAGPGPAFSFEYECCSQAAEAVKRVEQAIAEDAPFAMIFMDVRMPPGRDGVWAAERIRKIDPDVNIAIVTGFSDFDPKLIAQKVPPVNKLLYLRKPLHPEEIRHLAVSMSEKWIIERELKTSEERYALAARGTADGLWDWNLQDDRVFYSERWKAILGHKNAEIGDSPGEWYGKIHPEDIDRKRNINPTYFSC